MTEQLTDTPHPKDYTAPRLADEVDVPQRLATTLSLQAYLEKLAAAPLYNLPVTLTDFVGRQTELETLRELLSHQRLVTLVGLGGVGKTRLALQVAAEARTAFDDGICFVPLVAVATPELLVSALVEAIQLPTFQDADLKRHLLDYLRHKHLLLVLDNFEHLIPAAGLLTDLLEQAPDVKVLVTSRERLNLYGEWVLEISGLRLPEGEAAQEVEACDAVRLFVQSARRVCPGFSLPEADQAHVVRICQLVDGLPLALELAGAWVRVLSCEEIAAGIEKDLDFLSTEWTNVPERHRSILAVFERSWGLLDERERQIFKRLSAFTRGFSKKTAEQVAEATLTELAALVDQSFLSWNPERRRYAIHPLLQRYAEEALEKEPAECNRIRDAHCEHFTAFLREREETVRGKNQQQVLQEIGEEIGNIYAAWRWAAERGKIGCIEAGLETLYQFYETRSRFQEGQALFAWAVQKVTSDWDGTKKETQRVLLKLQARQDIFLFRLGEVNEARDGLQDGLAAFRVVGELAETVFCLSQLAKVAIFEGRLEQAIELASEALSLARVGRLRWAEAENLYRLGAVSYHQGDYEAGKQHFQQALQIYHELGNRRGEGTVLHALGVSCLDIEDYDKAIGYHQQVLNIFSQLGDLRWVAVSLDGLGSAHCSGGDYIEAKTYYEQALVLERKIGDTNGEGRTLSNLGNLFLSLGACEQAENYLEQALSTFRETGRRLDESIVLSNIGWLAYNLERYETACNDHQQALALAQEVGSHSQRGYALTSLGHALLELGRLTESTLAYQEALALRRELGLRIQAAESLSGLARVALAQGNPTQAQTHVDEILGELPGQTPGSEADLFQIYLTCYQVLRANQDLRAPDILHTAHRLLQEQAARINDDDLRRSFLQNVPSHRGIENEFALLVESSGGEATTPASVLSPDLVEPLTRQEIQVLRLLAEGLTNRQIAERLVITIGTVKSHAHSIYGKLGVENRTQAVTRARTLNLI